MDLLLGEDESLQLPHPHAGMDDFISSLRSQLASTESQFNVISGKIAPLIDLDKLKSHFKTIENSLLVYELSQSNTAFTTQSSNKSHADIDSETR